MNIKTNFIKIVTLAVVMTSSISYAENMSIYGYERHLGERWGGVKVDLDGKSMTGIKKVSSYEYKSGPEMALEAIGSWFKSGSTYVTSSRAIYVDRPDVMEWKPDSGGSIRLTSISADGLKCMNTQISAIDEVMKDPVLSASFTDGSSINIRALDFSGCAKDSCTALINQSSMSIDQVVEKFTSYYWASGKSIEEFLDNKERHPAQIQVRFVVASNGECKITDKSALLNQATEKMKFQQAHLAAEQEKARKTQESADALKSLLSGSSKVGSQEALSDDVSNTASAQ